MECLSYCKSEKEQKSNKNVISQILLYNEVLAIARKYAVLETPDSFCHPRDGAGPSAMVASVTGRASMPTKTAAIPTFPGFLRHSNIATIPCLKLTWTGAQNLSGNMTAVPDVLENEGLI